MECPTDFAGSALGTIGTVALLGGFLRSVIDLVAEVPGLVHVLGRLAAQGDRLFSIAAVLALDSLLLNPASKNVCRSKNDLPCHLVICV